MRKRFTHHVNGADTPAPVFHVEAPGCIVNIRAGLREDHTRRSVTVVEILCDRYGFQPRSDNPDDRAPWTIEGAPGVFTTSIRVVQEATP